MSRLTIIFSIAVSLDTDNIIREINGKIFKLQIIQLDHDSQCYGNQVPGENN
jgi:hypothetical protein